MNIKQKLGLCIMLCFSGVSSGYQLEAQIEKDAGSCIATETDPCEYTCVTACEAIPYYTNIGVGHCVNGECRCLCGDPGEQYYQANPTLFQEE